MSKGKGMRRITLDYQWKNIALFGWFAVVEMKTLINVTGYLCGLRNKLFLW